MTQSAYIHIPFCKRKCYYCSFVSYENKRDLDFDDYLKILLKEIEYFYKGENLKTLYIGGGTPSIVDAKYYKKILKLFSFEKDAEITIEINPETVDIEYLSALKEIGFNRISIGVQSFDDKILNSIGRVHNSARAIETVKAAQNVGFYNISVDFIYGLPGQTLDGFVNDLKKAVGLCVSHIALYGLKIEKGCKFFIQKPDALPDDDMQADMYLAAIKYLGENGFLHYEISNFCKPEKYSRHNLNYWNDGEYYGFGAAAHGYVNNVRYSNFPGLEQYQNNFTQKQYSKVLSKKEQLEETIFLGFRKGEGINIQEINSKFDIDFENLFSKIIDKYVQSGHLIKTQTGYRLSDEGFLLSNIVLSEFI